MFARILSHLTFANVCSVLALTVALSTGTAYAANTVFSTDIVNGEVKQADLAKNSVVGPKIKADTITMSDLGVSSVGSDEIGTDAVNATEIADSSIDGGEIVNDSLGASDLAASSVGTSEIANSSITGADVAGNSLTAADLLGGDSNGSISLGSGFAPIGGCNDIGVSVPGAALNEAVVFSLRGTVPEGMLFYGVGVTSAGTVTLKVCNFTGGTSPALAGVPVRILTFG